MSRFPFLLVVLLCLCGTSQGATFKNDALEVSLSGKSTSHTYGFAIIRASDNTFYSSASYTPIGGLGSASITKTVSSAQLNFDFYIVAFSAYAGLYSNVDNAGATGGAGVRYRWISAYEVGGNESQNSSNGPYSGTNPTNENGSPADPAVGGTPPPTAYEKDVTLINSSAVDQKGFNVKMKGEAGNVISSTTHILQPGETQVLHLKADEPFTVEVYEMVQVKQPDEEFPGDGNTLWMNSGGPVQTSTAEGTQNDAPEGGTPQVTQGSSTKTGTQSPQAVSDESRPGDPEGNADARNEELRNEIARGVEQTRMSGDEVRDAVDRATKELGKITGNGGGSSGAELGTPSESGLSFATGIQGKITGIGEALGNLVAAAGLTNSPGYNALTWNVEVMGHSHSFSVEQFDAEISAARQGVLWIAGAFFVWAAFSIARGAFVDEGK